MNFSKNIFSLFTERRSVSKHIDAAVSKTLNDFTLDTLNPDVYVDEKTSLSISAVWACVRIISESVAMLPVHLKLKTEDGRETVTDHAVCSLLRKPNPLMNGVTFRQSLMVSVLLWGNGYAHIVERDKYYSPTRMNFILPYRIRVVEGTDDVYYSIDGRELIPSRDMIHIRNISIDGITGISPIGAHRENMQLTMQAQKFGVNFFKNGCHSTGIFESDSTYSTEAYDRLKEQLYMKYTGLSNASKPLLLEGGLKFNKITIPPEDAQFIATRKFQKTEIATIFGVPPHMIADLERSTNNNIEHQGMEFVQYCLMPYIIKIESELCDKLLREDERKCYYVHFEFNGLLRSDAKTRSEYYKNMNFIGTMNANEIRAKEDMNKYKGGEHYFVQSNMQTVDRAINPTTIPTPTNINNNDSDGK